MWIFQNRNRGKRFCYFVKSSFVVLFSQILITAASLSAVELEPPKEKLRAKYFASTLRSVLNDARSESIYRARYGSALGKNGGTRAVQVVRNALQWLARHQLSFEKLRPRWDDCGYVCV